MVVIPISIASCLVENINTAQLTRLAPRQSMTSIIAVDMSLASGLSLVIPSFTTVMIKTLGYSSIGAWFPHTKEQAIIVFENSLSNISSDTT